MCIHKCSKNVYYVVEIFKKKKMLKQLDIAVKSVKKMQIVNIGLRHALSWSKVGLKPKFHEAMAFSE